MLELEPGSAWAQRCIERLEPQVKERHEKLKNEMFGKLKVCRNFLLPYTVQYII